VQIGKVNRVRLGLFPTPLQELAALSRGLGIRLFVKRDDLSGLGLGGNKLRKLEYAMAEAKEKGATAIITAAAANRLGLKPRLVLVGKKPETATGNLLVDRILGVEEIHYVDYVKGDT